MFANFTFLRVCFFAIAQRTNTMFFEETSAKQSAAKAGGLSALSGKKLTPTSTGRALRGVRPWRVVSRPKRQAALSEQRLSNPFATSKYPLRVTYHGPGDPIDALFVRDGNRMATRTAHESASGVGETQSETRGEKTGNTPSLGNHVPHSWPRAGKKGGPRQPSSLALRLRLWTR